MKKRLEGKTALVTGGTRGIGAAVALAYAREGAHVIILGRTTGAMARLDDQIKEMGGTATLMPVDMLKLDELDMLGPTLAGRFEKLDIFVGNAGMLGDLSPLALSDAKIWEKTIDLNLHANYRLIRTLDPLLKASEAGRVIFVTSGIVGMHLPFWNAYAVSKAALEEMAKIYAVECEDTNIRVNLVDPGVVKTKMRAEAFPGEDPETLPDPEVVTEAFIELAMSDCTLNGAIKKAA